MRFADDWWEQLSRGEYDQSLYWECVAEDCEDAGDWNDAIAAYRQILDLPEAHEYERGKAYSCLAAIQRLLGDEDASLESRHNASAIGRPFSNVLARQYLCSEASQLLRMNRINDARRLFEEGLATHDENDLVDHLGMAKLLTVFAQCELADNQPESARKSLTAAMGWLESLRAAHESVGAMEDAIGVVAAYARWWQAAAAEFDLTGDYESAIDALCKARDYATQCAEECGWSRYDFDHYQMNVLRELAAQYSKQERHECAREAMRKANEIRARQKFPL